MKKTQLNHIAINQLVMLRRNPQYLTPKQMDSLKRSIERDGFVAPILVRSISSERFEIISGNLRFMAAKEIGYDQVPCVICKMSDKDAKRLAINLNTIHGEPNAELLAPFLAEMDDDLLAQIHIENKLLEELISFDKELETRLSELSVPEKMDHDSPKSSTETCSCPKCGARHFRK